MVRTKRAERADGTDRIDWIDRMDWDGRDGRDGRDWLGGWEGVWLESFPEGAEGDGPLEFAGVFADEEGEVFLVEEAEVRGEGIGDPVDGAVRGPVGGRGEFL